MKESKFRQWIQLFATVLANGYLIGFMKGKIFTGTSKHVCLPVLNCYSCPGALGACPIGSMQAVLGNHKRNFSFYILGLIMLFGVVFGRLICGFLCPFGFIQDLLYKIKAPKLKIPKKVDKPMRYIKYAIFLVFVIVLPKFLTNKFGIGAPYFCKLICPAGTLEGSIPLLFKNESLRNSVGMLFYWKFGILVFIILASVFTYRPFCKYLCPLGAFYALFNKVSFYSMSVDKNKCNGCKMCERKCKMNVEIIKNINSTECIRCGECEVVCPQNAISSGFKLKGAKNDKK